jgi:hypothetical protein
MEAFTMGASPGVGLAGEEVSAGVVADIAKLVVRRAFDGRPSVLRPVLLKGLEWDPRMGSHRAGKVDAMGLCQQSDQDVVWQVRSNYVSPFMFGLGCI